MKEALFYKRLPNKNAKCNLCPRNCVIKEGSNGFCRVRKNINGKLYSLNYGKVAAIGIDKIEKKPMYMFAPGSECLSIATVGCNLNCIFCQNYSISHEWKEIYGEEHTPEQIVKLAIKNNCQGIAYTYVEPTIFLEYTLDIMKLAKKAGLYNVWVSNGFTNPEPVKLISKYLDAINVDLKGDIKFYKKLCGVPSEQPVYQALIEYKKAGVWIEITNLIIPTYNDKKEQIKKLVKWVKDNLGKSTPIHFSRFYPQYKLTNIQPTPVSTLKKAMKLAKKQGLEYVYLGNIAGHKYESTFCPKCNTLLIQRIGPRIVKSNLKNNCPKCKNKIPIKGKKWSPIF